MQPLPEKPTALSRRLIYHSRWVNLYVDRVQFPNGTLIENHHLLDFEQHAVLAVARDQDGRYLMVKVCRYPTGRSEWEFPAGRLEAGEDPLRAAQRELKEESGYDSGEHALVYTYHPFGGISNQVYTVVRCQVRGQAGEYDQNEISGVRWVAEEEIWGMIRAGEMMDGFTLTAFLLDQHGQTGAG